MSDGPQPSRTLVVMLGGSEYPRNPDFDNPRFKQSAEDLRAYFLDPERFGLPESNLLWLFDSRDATGDLNDRIDEFLRVATDVPVDTRPLDIIVSYIGHGFHDDRKRYHLATPSFRPGSPEYSLPFALLQRTVKERMRHARKYYILDACYSASAAGEMMEMDGESVAKKVLSEARQQTLEDMPSRGTVVLCAAAKDEVALAPKADAHTMFTGALLAVFERDEYDGAILNVHQLKGAVSGEIVRKFQAEAVLPELHVPDQDQGDIGDVKLFPVRRQAGAADGAALLDALAPTTFSGDARLHAVVVGRQRQGGEQLSALQQAVVDAWSNSGRQIVAAVDRCRAAWRAPLVPTADVNGGLVLAELCLERACTSKEALERAVAALCRAEIAVFDLTDWDPIATFLLGVRAVARRGVTITIRSGREAAIPFNLQLLNITELTKGGAGKRASEVLSAKIVNGFTELLNLPHYLDLPAYDSVRQLGIDASAYRPIRMAESVLMLCPFSPAYTDANFDRLETMLPPRIEEHVEKAEKRNVGRPALLRLLNLKTPRLVAQTLFESIRLTDMCVIDWTGGNTNVVFEAGVRMAINPLGAVHVIERGAYDALQRSASSGTLMALLRRLEPIPYQLKGFDASPFEKMVQRFEASVEASGRRETNFVYKAVGEAIDRRSQPAALPLVTELARSANLLDTEDREGGGISPVLFHDVNAELAREAREAAADRRLAAWLFISRRHEPGDIAAQPELLDDFELLSFQVKRWARRAGRVTVLDEVNGVLDGVRKAAALVAPADTLSDERQAARLIARAKRDKEEAKDLREVKDVTGAVALLEQTVKALAASPLASGLTTAPDPSRLQKDLAAQLADCYGMLGGNCRRVGDLERALHSFVEGVAYEESEALEVMSSYNLVNSITMPIENNQHSVREQTSQIKAAIAAIGRQVRSQRRTDRWAWADLAQCQLLLGERAQALQSYGRVLDLGDEQTVSSIVPVLQRLAGVVPERAEDIKAAIETLSSGARA